MSGEGTPEQPLVITQENLDRHATKEAEGIAPHEFTPETGTPGFAKGVLGGQALNDNDTVDDLSDAAEEERPAAQPERY